MNIKIQKLAREDIQSLFTFECENREYFETMVPSRGDEYYEINQFTEFIHELLTEQENGLAYFHLIKNESDIILGRINIIDIDQDNLFGHLGYRIGQKHAGKGIASEAVSILLGDHFQSYGLKGLHAKTTSDNLASQRVLLKNNFNPTITDDTTLLMNGVQHTFYHYIWKK